MRTRTGALLILAPPAACFVAGGLFSFRLAVGTFTRSAASTPADYLQVTPVALGLSYLTAGALCLATALVLVWILFRRRTFKLLASAGASLLVASVVSLAVMRVAWIENTQGEIHGPGYIDWLYWLAFGVSWFLPAYLLTFLSAVSVGALISLLSRRAHPGHAA